mgnify:CR=1 FL=1
MAGDHAARLAALNQCVVATRAGAHVARSYTGSDPAIGHSARHIAKTANPIFISHSPFRHIPQNERYCPTPLFRIADLFVIRLATADLAGAVDLLQQHHARQVMRQGNASKAEHLVGAGAHLIAHAVRTANHKGDVAAAS